MSVISIMALAHFKQLLARGIELPIEDCQAIMAAVIEETAGIGAEMERAKERVPA
jgi:hypothetical protein